MPKINEVIGFGKGKNIDIKKSLREELEYEEKLENELILEGEIMLQNLNQSFHLNEEGIINNIPHEILCIPNFWERVLGNKKYNINPNTIFSMLPVDILKDIEIQNVFFKNKEFNICYLRKNILECINKDLLIKKLFLLKGEDLSNTYFIKEIPFKILDKTQKIDLVNKILNEGGYNFREVQVLDGRRDEFKDSISENEWNLIIKNCYYNNYQYKEDIFFSLIEGDIDRVLQIFSKEELRENLKCKCKYKNNHRSGYFLSEYKNQHHYKCFLELPLTKLHVLEFDEESINKWKTHIEENNTLNNGFECYEKMSEEDQQYMMSVLKLRGENLEEDEKYTKENLGDFISNKLPELLKKISPQITEQTLDSLNNFLFRFKKEEKYILEEEELINGFLIPLFESQTNTTFKILQIMNQNIKHHSWREYIKLFNWMIPNKESSKNFRTIMSMAGAKFMDFLSFYLDTRYILNDNGNIENFYENTSSLNKDANLIPFLETKLPLIRNIFLKYEKMINDGFPKKQVIEILNEEVNHGIQEIIDGEFSDDRDIGLLSADDLGLITYVFPPALGISRDQYFNLINKREDRQMDVPYEWNELQGYECSIPIGKWELNKDEVFETKVFSGLCEIIQDVNNKKIIHQLTEEKKIIY